MEIPPNLLKCVQDYKALRLSGSVHLARTMKKNIDREIAWLGLDPKSVYGDDADDFLEGRPSQTDPRPLLNTLDTPRK